MRVGRESLYCTAVEVKDCPVGGDAAIEVLEEQVARSQENLMKRVKIYPSEDKTIAEFMGTNPMDYFPIEMVYSLDEIYRLLLVKVWEIDTSIFKGSIAQFKAQFFFFEYVIPMSDEETISKLLNYITDNVLDHYAQTVSDTHSQTSKSTEYTIDSLKTEIGLALRNNKITDHVCFYKSWIIS